MASNEVRGARFEGRGAAGLAVEAAPPPRPGGSDGVGAAHSPRLRSRFNGVASAMYLEALADVAPVLIFGIGNPSRGDDAIGPALIERLSRRQAAGRLDGVDLLTDFQLQPEHALDLRGRARVIFVDASLEARAPFALSSPSADAALAHTTHSTSPQQLLAVYERLYGTAPQVQLLAVRGYRFELGAELTGAARANLDAACSRIVALLSASEPATAISG